MMEGQDAKLRTKIMTTIEELFEALPEGGPDEKAAVLCGAVLEASGLKGGAEWCVLARLVSDAHGGKPAAVVLNMPGEGDERMVVSFSSDGTVGAVPATVAGTVDGPTHH